MNIFQNTLIASAPAETLLLVGIVFTSAALILFALALDAGHYKDVTAWLKLQWRKNPWSRHKHLTVSIRSDVGFFNPAAKDL